MRDRIINSDVTTIAQIITLLSIMIIGCSNENGFMGQGPPGDKPIPFAAEVLTAERHPHGCLAFTPDGKRIYWSAYAGKNDRTSKIFISEFDGETLSAPELAPFAKSYYNGGLAISSDGGKFIFSSNRPVGIDDSGGNFTLWINDGHDNYTLFANPDTTLNIFATTLAKNGNLYFCGKGSNDNLPKVYISEYSDGNFSNPAPLPGKIHDLGDVTDPFIDPDERFIIFTSMLAENNIGESDLYISFKRDDGSWGEGINLGSTINTPDFERFPSLSPDGKYLFFIRATGKSYITAKADFYWVNAKILDSLINQARIK